VDGNLGPKSKKAIAGSGEKWFKCRWESGTQDWKKLSAFSIAAPAAEPAQHE